MKIPSKVFDKYEEFVDCMIDDLGINCQLVYIDTVSETTANVPQPQSNRSMRLRNTGGPNVSKRASTKLKTTESTEDIQLRVYFNRRDFIKISNIQVPDGSVQTIGYLSDMPKILKAKHLIVNSDIKLYREYRYKKLSEPQPWGLLKRKYFVCVWERT